MENNGRSDNISKAVELATRVAEETQTDIYFYSGEINEEGWDSLLREFGSAEKSPNSNLMLTTYGGDINFAYRIARLLQKYSNEFVVSIPSICKSAGTLIALGANSIIMSDFAEIGPLDVQLARRDELGEARSGMVARTALEELRREAFQIFSQIMLGIKAGSKNVVSFEVSSRIATGITTGVMTPIYAQIDPDSLGNDLRDLQIATEYGSRLAHYGQNVRSDTIEKLVEQYPSHNFIVDKQETGTLFHNVENPTDDTLKLWALLEPVTSSPQEPPIVKKLNQSPGEDDDETDPQGDANARFNEGTAVQKENGKQEKSNGREGGEPATDPGEPTQAILPE